MSVAFRLPINIANRAMQHVGARRLATLTEDTKNASEFNACYDMLREAELRRNVWRFATRKAVLRPVDTTTLKLVPAAYDGNKTYITGAVVSDSNVVYIANGPVPTASTPASYPDLWSRYYGPMTVNAYDDDISYASGELVYTPATSAYAIYLSLVSGNEDDPADVPAYDATVTYSKHDTVTYSAAVYQSTLDLNLGNTPGVSGWEAVPGTQPVRRQGRKWLRLNATGTSVSLVYPLGAGPASADGSRNVFMLPNGFLREAPLDPKAFLPYTDYDLEGNYLIGRGSDPIIYRFVADVSDVSQMDPMFCEGLAARIALEVCEPLTQSTTKLQNIGIEYSKFMMEARIVNSIETGPTEPPEDDYITCRA